MERLRITVDLPEDALAISQLSRQAAGEEMRRLFFLEGAISRMRDRGSWIADDLVAAVLTGARTGQGTP